jgi:hypothetical protein
MITLFKNYQAKIFDRGFEAGFELAKSKMLYEMKAADPSHPLYQWNNPAFRLGYDFAMSVAEEVENKC